MMVLKIHKLWLNDRKLFLFQLVTVYSKKNFYPNFVSIAGLVFFVFLSVDLAAATNLTPKPPIIKAKSYILMDYDSDQILAEKEADERMEPASLTKMMTAYVVAKEISRGSFKLTDRVRISKKARRMTGSRMFVEQGSHVMVQDLLKGLIVPSGNDAAIALVEKVAGNEIAFVSMMNNQADALSMHDTHFNNSTGMPDPKHYSTARDLAALGQALIRDYPKQYALYSLKHFKFNRTNQRNRNKLLWSDSTVDGIKTGYTDSAGYCLVASAERNGMRLISVVLGAKNKKSRAKESSRLLSYGFRFFETHRLYTANKALKTVRIWKGAEQRLKLGLDEDLYVTIPKGQYKKLDATMSVNPEILAPAAKGITYGTVNITLGERNYAVRKVIALDQVKEGSLYQYMMDSVKLIFH
jgi:D-alanyl-D-alanine carboxypeptidase (penicillin-binding protein 5/6)